MQCLDWMAEGKLDGKPLITDLISLDALPAVYEKRIDTGLAVKVMVDMQQAVSIKQLKAYGLLLKALLYQSSSSNNRLVI